jgi:glycosyltransferase involved in cell wall biosynthesis
VSKPLVSVITPTWGQRHEKLVNRCIPSVQAQAYPKVEHVIVSDGPDYKLSSLMLELMSGSAFTHRTEFSSLKEHDPEPHWGHHARLRGIEMSAGEYIAYCDDDDALRPDHVRLLAGVLSDDPSVGWAYSVMASHSRSGEWFHVGAGAGAPMGGQIGTPMIMHRRSVLEHGTWGPASATEDWELVQRWLAAGVTYGRVHEVTVDVWPSSYWS